MSLREEITDFIDVSQATSSTIRADQILKLFEKRINLLLDDVKKEREYAFRNDFNELMRETAHAQNYIGKVKEMLK